MGDFMPRYYDKEKSFYFGLNIDDSGISEKYRYLYKRKRYD